MRENLKAIILTVIIFTLLLTVLTIDSFAVETEIVTVKLKTNEINALGDITVVCIDWGKEQEAIGFTLEYDSTKLEYIDNNSNFVNGEIAGQVIVAWACVPEEEEAPKTKMYFRFRNIALGEAIIKIKDVDCMADGNLVSPDEIDFATEGTKTIKIFAIGDVNSDGEVDTDDFTRLSAYVENPNSPSRPVLTAEQLINADIDLDGVIDELDCKLLGSYANNKGVSMLPVRYGDICYDGYIDEIDLELLTAYFSGATNEVFERDYFELMADFNGDGVINRSDPARLKHYLTNSETWPVIRVLRNPTLQVKVIGNQNILSGFLNTRIRLGQLRENFDTKIHGYVAYNVAGEMLTEDETILGTGTKLYIEDFSRWTDDNEVEHDFLSEYNIVIYGDTTGDGKINAIDALALIKDLNEAIPFANEIYREAGHILETEEPTAADALAIIKHSNGKQQISQVK